MTTYVTVRFLLDAFFAGLGIGFVLGMATLFVLRRNG